MPSDEHLEEIERHIHEQLTFHRQQYLQAIEPLVKQLANLELLKPHRYTIALQDAVTAGLIPPPF